MRITAGVVAAALLTAACASEAGGGFTEAVPGAAAAATTTSAAAAPAERVDAFGAPFPPSPGAPDGPLDPAVTADLALVLGDVGTTVDVEAIGRLGASGDARLAWLLSDLLRFVQRGHVADASVAAFEELTGADVTASFPWRQVTDWLIAWDLPAPPGYVDWKRRLFEFVEPGWAPFFDDAGAAIDWRLVSWGGVLIDDRPLDAVRRRCPEGCIPALDDPAVTDAAGGDWYPDDAVVFGVVVGGEARAYPKNIMQVHEMVNDTVGGRRIAMPYCTLCGSAQTYLTDEVPAGVDGVEVFELRTSGLLSRSNKVMYEFHTRSVLDTFTGVALSGPLRETGVRLEEITTYVSTWGEWKAAHPDTTIVAEDGGIGFRYLDDPLQGRDDAGPIFPTGPVDPRLRAHEQVLGVIAPDGTAWAFPVEAAMRALDAGDPVEVPGVRVVGGGAGLGAETPAGVPIVTHQAFWFAWSQFNPDTGLWTEVSVGG